MLREKIVASAAARFVVIIDAAKYSTRLHGRVPVEVVAFGAARTVRVLAERTSLEFALRTAAGGAPITTDNGNLIADSEETDIADPAALAAIIESVPGCAGHGLFLGMADLVLIGHEDGSVDELTARA